MKFVNEMKTLIWSIAICIILLINSTPISAAEQWVKLDTDYKSTQGMCFDKAGNLYVARNIDKDSTKGVIIKIGPKGEKIKKQVKFDFGHANDMTCYNGYLYVIDSRNPKVHVYSTNGLEYKFSYTVPKYGKKSYGGIEIDAGGNVFLKRNTHIVWGTFTEDYRFLTRGYFDLPQDEYAGYTSQGMAIHENHLYVGYWKGGENDKDRDTSYIVKYNIYAPEPVSREAVKKYKKYKKFEIEGVDFKDGRMFISYNGVKKDGNEVDGILSDTSF